MMRHLLVEWLIPRGEVPDKFTLAMGELIRKARQEAHLSQAELAKMVYRRQATLSDIENGKIRVDAETLVYLAYALNKPVPYFFPEKLAPMAPEDTLDALQQELSLITKGLGDDDLRRLVAVARALKDFSDSSP